MWGGVKEEPGGGVKRRRGYPGVVVQQKKRDTGGSQLGRKPHGTIEGVGGWRRKKGAYGKGKG